MHAGGTGGVAVRVLTAAGQPEAGRTPCRAALHRVALHCVAAVILIPCWIRATPTCSLGQGANQNSGGCTRQVTMLGRGCCHRGAPRKSNICMCERAGLHVIPHISWVTGEECRLHVSRVVQFSVGHSVLSTMLCKAVERLCLPHDSNFSPVRRGA